jgi:YihY family inner membrane protein
VSVVDRVDSYQRRHNWLGFPLAVIYKYFDDRGPYLSALVTYYAFVSLFPLLLLVYSALGFFLQGHAEVSQDLQQSVLSQFPVIGPKLAQNISEFRGSGVALAIGILGTLYGAMGATQAAQAGFNRIYGVPRHRQPNPIKSRLRSLGLLALLGTGVLLANGIPIILSTANGISSNLGDALHIAGYLLSYVVNVALFSAAFQLLTARDLRFRQVVVGGLVAAGLWMLVVALGSSFVSHILKRTEHLYGVFAIVLAILAWFYIQSVILMLAGEINVVLEYRLWPRSLLSPFTDDAELTGADRRAYRLYAQVERFKSFETVTTDFEVPGDGTGTSPPDAQPGSDDAPTIPAEAPLESGAAEQPP